MSQVKILKIKKSLEVSFYFFLILFCKLQLIQKILYSNIYNVLIGRRVHESEASRSDRRRNNAHSGSLIMVTSKEHYIFVLCFLTENLKSFSKHAFSRNTNWILLLQNKTKFLELCLYQSQIVSKHSE